MLFRQIFSEQLNFFTGRISASVQPCKPVSTGSLLPQVALLMLGDTPGDILFIYTVFEKIDMADE